MNETVSTPQRRRRITPTTCSVIVKLSYGDRKPFSVRKEATVSELSTEVAKFEAGDFELIQNSRALDPSENVSKICTSLIEVLLSSTTFSVHVDGEDYSFKSANGDIRFDEFVQRLSERSNLDIDVLGSYKYHCKGCERRITKEKQAFQVFKCKCCEEKSLNLIAEAAIMPKALNDAEVQTSQTSLNVKLVVFYWPNEITANLRNTAIEGSVEYSWRRLKYVRCQISMTLENGRVPFVCMRNALEPLFLGSRILMLVQWSGTKDDEEFAWATANDDELEEDDRRREYVDCNGKVVSYSGVKIFRWELVEGNHVLICGGQWRTVIQINSLQ